MNGIQCNPDIGLLQKGFETAIAVYELSLTANHMAKPEYLPGWEGWVILFDNTS
jgi:hypothetical protein